MSYDSWKTATPPEYREDLPLCDVCNEEPVCGPVYSRRADRVLQACTGCMSTERAANELDRATEAAARVNSEALEICERAS